MSTPELKQIRDLSAADLERQPVWIGVHNADFGKPWWNLADETTYRPWTESLPAQAETGFVLVAATAVLRDESKCPGFMIVAEENWDVPPPPRKLFGAREVEHRAISARYGGSPLLVLGIQQPCIFMNGQHFSFWGGRRGVSVERRQAFYAAIGKPPEAIFPLRFNVDPKYATGILTSRVDGFYRLIREQPPLVEL